MNEIDRQLKMAEKYKNNPKYAEAYQDVVAELRRRKIKLINSEYGKSDHV